MRAQSGKTTGTKAQTTRGAEARGRTALAERPIGVIVGSRMGTFGLIHDGRRILKVLYPEALATRLRARMAEAGVGEVTPKVPAFLRGVAKAISDFLDKKKGDPASLSVELEDAGIPDFHRKVYAEVRRIPRGACATYGEIAKRVGSPGAARAVGQAMAKNPWPLLVPCHRVVGSSGGLGGFSGGEGIASKATMLRHEGAIVMAAEGGRGTGGRR